jgi:hypothetical protein
LEDSSAVDSESGATPVVAGVDLGGSEVLGARRLAAVILFGANAVYTVWCYYKKRKSLISVTYLRETDQCPAPRSNASPKTSHRQSHRRVL